MDEISSNVICQFLEASIHHILWRRGLYPEVIFASRLAFSVPIKASVHPEVNTYISKSLTCFRDILNRPNITVQGIDLVILDDKEDVVEKYIFQMSRLRCIPQYHQRPQSEIADEALNIVDEIPSSVRNLFRNCLLKLTHRVSELTSLDFAQEHSFNMEIHLSENGEEFLAQNHVDIPWLKKENSILPLINKVTRTLPVFRDEDPFHLEVFIDLIMPDHHEF